MSNTLKSNEATAPAQASAPVVHSPDLPVWTPRTDAYQTEKASVIVMDLPGVSREDLEVELENQTLRVSAKAPAPPSEGKKWLVREFGGRRYARTFRIGKKINVEKMNARLRNGVLTLTMPIRQEIMAKKIEISE